MAAEAVRKFLEGLRENRLEATDPEARNALRFLLEEVLSNEFRVRRWRMGAGIQSPEGGFSFPVLLDSETGRVRGEIHAAYHSASGWGVDLAIIDTENRLETSGSHRKGFDPAIRTAESVKK